MKPKITKLTKTINDIKYTVTVTEAFYPDGETKNYIKEYNPPMPFQLTMIKG